MNIQNYIFFKKIRIFLLKVKLNYVKFKIILANIKYYILKKLLDFTLILLKFIKIYRYIWVILFAITCILVNIIFKSWPYKDYIWISVIISLLITSIKDTQDMQENEN